MTRRSIALLVIALTMSGCVSTDAVMMESGVHYPPTQNVQLLTQVPTRPHKQIAMIEVRGAVDTPMPKLLESMKQKAAAVGADAVIPTEDASTKQQQGLIFNPMLGGYQTFGGGRMPVIRGVAIKYTD